MLAAAEPGLVEGLLLLSYPLHPPKQPAQMRTGLFPNLQTRSLFVSGSRDGFGTVEEMSDALRLIPAETRLVTIEGAGHELMSKRRAEELPKRVAEEFQGFFS
jgi:predicted alpha/beta-hydrolase family hydrolase